MITYIYYSEWEYLIDNNLLTKNNHIIYCYNNDYYTLIFPSLRVKEQLKLLYNNMKSIQEKSLFSYWMFPPYAKENLLKYRRFSKIQKIKNI